MIYKIHAAFFIYQYVCAESSSFHIESSLIIVLIYLSSTKTHVVSSHFFSPYLEVEIIAQSPSFYGY